MLFWYKGKYFERAIARISIRTLELMTLSFVLELFMCELALFIKCLVGPEEIGCSWTCINGIFWTGLIIK